MTQPIPFHRVSLSGRELVYLQEALEGRHIQGDGPFTRRCEAHLAALLGAKAILLTHSCTAALEMAALIAGVGPGDEVIMPSFTFVSTANAFVLRGATPVFVDVRRDTLNLDERLVEAALTPRTKAIVPVHYAGISCEMDRLGAIAAARGLVVIEDAAQGLYSSYKGRALGTLGALGTLSFHQTKNVTSGEGGALIVNDPVALARAEIIREKGTDRRRYLRGEIDRYTWQDVGSSYIKSDLLAAVLLAQLEGAAPLQSRRRELWDRFGAELAPLATRGDLTLPTEPAGLLGNAHLFYLLVRTPETRPRLAEHLKARGIGTASHFVPLHDAAGGAKFGRPAGPLPVTDEIALTLLRLPLYPDLSDSDAARIIAAVKSFY